MRARVVTPPQPVVTWEEARAHLRLDGDDELVLVEAMIAAATGHIDGPDGWLGRAIGVQTIEARCDCVGNGPLRLPYAPVIAVDEIVLFGEHTATVVDPALYRLMDGCVIVPPSATWPTMPAAWGVDRVRIEYRAGYVENVDADPLVARIPAPIRAAILLMVGDLYANRETVMIGASASAVPMSTTVENLLAPYRVFT